MVRYTSSILPNGLAEELNLTNANLSTRPTPVPGMPVSIPILDFCGIAIDPSDNIYTVDSYISHYTTL